MTLYTVLRADVPKCRKRYFCETKFPRPIATKFGIIVSSTLIDRLNYVRIVKCHVLKRTEKFYYVLFRLLGRENCLENALGTNVIIRSTRFHVRVSSMNLTSWEFSVQTSKPRKLRSGNRDFLVKCLIHSGDRVIYAVAFTKVCFEGRNPGKFNAGVKTLELLND
jgi:hypothetical protein